MMAFDYGVLAILACSMLLGAWRGLASELLALAAWVVALLAASEAAAPIGATLAKWITDPALQILAGFMLTVVVVLFAAALLRLTIRKLLSAVGLGPTDRFLGAGFGFIRAMVIVIGLVLLGGFTALPRQKWWRDAYLAPPFETAALMLKPWLPQRLARRLQYR